MPCNRPRGGHQVAVRERDLLGAAGGAARVEQEGDVVRLRGLEVLRRAHVPAVHLHAARAAVLDEELADADPDAARCPGRRGLVGGEEREPRVQVLHEEDILVVRVCRVQRGGRRSERDDGQQGLKKNRSIGNDQHDAIAPGHARGAQDAGHLPHRLGQAAEIETQPVGDVQRRRGRRAAEQRRERLISLGSRGTGRGRHPDNASHTDCRTFHQSSSRCGDSSLQRQRAAVAQHDGEAMRAVSAAATKHHSQPACSTSAPPIAVDGAKPTSVAVTGQALRSQRGCPPR